MSITRNTSRRGFLKSTAGVASAAGLVPLGPLMISAAIPRAAQAAGLSVGFIYERLRVCC